LLVTAIVSALLFIDGYNFLDGFIFTGFFVAYLIVALFEMRSERNDNLKSREMSSEDSKQQERALESSRKNSINEKRDDRKNSGATSKLGGHTLRSILVFVAGTIGIVVGAGPFIHALEGFSVDIGVSAIILAVIISPIAGEMPEKISLMILARKGALGASIAIANVLGSKILNNTLLLAVAVFGAMYHAGFFTVIELTPVLAFQVVLVTVVTIIALIPMFKKEIGLKTGMMLMSMYIISIVIQFFMPHE
jgi:cation:H+ antiporter